MRRRLEHVAFPATVCGAILQINHTTWEGNAPDAELVLQGVATQTAPTGVRICKNQLHCGGGVESTLYNLLLCCTGIFRE